MDMTLEQQLQVFVDNAKRTDANYDAVMSRLQDVRLVKLLHCAMGLCTEAGEFMDMLKKHIFYGKPLDLVNALEELGDVSWYERIGIDAMEASYFGMLERNVAKLKARFPDKFTEHLANNRDLEAERRVLEGA